MKVCEQNLKQLQDSESSTGSKDEEINKKIEYELSITISFNSCVQGESLDDSPYTLYMQMHKLICVR